MIEDYDGKKQSLCERLLKELAIELGDHTIDGQSLFETSLALAIAAFQQEDLPVNDDLTFSCYLKEGQGFLDLEPLIYNNNREIDSYWLGAELFWQGERLAILQNRLPNNLPEQYAMPLYYNLSYSYDREQIDKERLRYLVIWPLADKPYEVRLNNYYSYPQDYKHFNKTHWLRRAFPLLKAYSKAYLARNYLQDRELSLLADKQYAALCEQALRRNYNKKSNKIITATRF